MDGKRQLRRQDLEGVCVCAVIVSLFLVGLLAGLPVSAVVVRLPYAVERQWLIDVADTLGITRNPDDPGQLGLAWRPDHFSLRVGLTMLAIGLLSVLIIILLPFFLRFSVAFYPSIEAMRRHAETGRYLSDRQLLFGQLIGCLDFEFFGITRVAHGTS